MSRHLFVMAAAGAAMILAGCASDSTGSRADGDGASTAASRQCFDPDMASGFTPGPDRNKVYLTVGVRDVYELDTSGFCQGLDWSWQIGIRSRTGGRVCEGYDAEIFARTLGGDRIERCAVTSVRKLSAEEAEARRTS